MVSNIEKLQVFNVNDLELLDTFLENNTKLIHLVIQLLFDNCWQTSEGLAMLSKLCELRILKISIDDFGEFDEQIGENIEVIGLNCKKLNCFALKVDRKYYFDSKLCFQNFKHLSSSLTRLSFNSLTPSTIPIQSLDSDCLKSLMNLTHLELSLDQINDHFFVDIGTKVPKLNYLWIGFFEQNITDEFVITR